MTQNQLYVLACALVAGLGGLLFGFDTAVISGANADLQRVFDLTNFWLGFTVSSALVGTIIGALGAGEPADRYGRLPMPETKGVPLEDVMRQMDVDPSEVSASS